MMQVREQAAEDADAERKGKRKAGSASRAAAAKKAKKEDGAVAKSATQVHRGALSPPVVFMLCSGRSEAKGSSVRVPIVRHLPIEGQLSSASQ